MNVLKNRQNEAAKRGAIVKALCFGCKNKVLLEPLSQLIEVTLDAIIGATNLNAAAEENLSAYQEIIH